MNLLHDRQSFSDLKTVTGCVSQTTVSLSEAERQPRVMTAIYTALLDRLAVVNRHMIVWIEWVPSIP